MTIIQAKNPTHVRTFDTSKLWWFEDAWNDHTVEWFVSDESGFRLEELLQAILRQQPANVPGLLPTSDKLLEIFQRHSHTRVNDFSIGASRGLSKPFQWMYEAGEGAQWKGGKETKTHYLAQYALCQVAEFTEADWANGRFHDGRLIRAALEANITDDTKPLFKEAAMLACNPHLPGLSFRANKNTHLSPYRWWAQQLVRHQTEYAGRGVRLAKAGPILSYLLSNVGATHDDLEFVLAEIRRFFPERATSNYERRASLNPNWEGDVQQAQSSTRLKQLLAPTYRPLVEMAPEDIDLDASAELSGSSYAFDLTEAAWEKLLRGGKEEVNQFLRNKLSVASDAENQRGGSDPAKGRKAMRSVAHLAPALGSLFREHTEAVGGESIPFEWILELL